MKKILLFAVIVLFGWNLQAQFQLNTVPPLNGGNGSAGITFNLTTNKTIIIDSLFATFSNTGRTEVWYNPTAINGQPSVTTANGWVQLGSPNVSTNANGDGSISPLDTAFNFLMTPGDTFGFFIDGSSGAALRYTTGTTGVGAPFSDNTITIETGANVGYGGSKTALTFTPRQFNGGVKYTIIGGANDASVLSVDSPSVFCSGTHDVVASIANFGSNQIDSVDVNWEVNGVAQPTLAYKQLLDTLGGTDTNIVQLNLGSASFNTGSNTIKVFTSNPNGVADTTNINDTILIIVNTASPPTALTTFNATLNSVQVNASGGAGNIVYEYGLFGFNLGTGTRDTSMNSIFTINGLNQGETYEIYARSDCGSNDTSAWVGPFVFNTSYGVPFFQDFENFGANTSGTINFEGWRNIVTGAPQWQTGSSTTSGSTGPEEDHTIGLGGTFAYLETSSGALGGTDTLVSPPIFIDSNYNVVELSYWYHMYGATISSLEVFADSNGTLNAINTITGQQQTAQNQASWLEYTAFLSGYQGKSVSLVFVATRGSSFTGDISIDDVAVDPVPQLNAGINEILDPGANGALCSGSSPIKVIVGNKGIDTLTSFSVVSNANGILDTSSFSITIPAGDTAHVTLSPATFVTGANNLSVYTLSPNNGTDGFNGDDTASIIISTANPPANFSTINQTVNSVDILADNFADSIQIEYGISGFTQGTGTLITSNSVPFTISGLNSGTSYEVYMRSICGTNDTSLWVGPFNFNTSYGIPFFQDFEAFTTGITGNPWPEGWSSTTTTDPNWESDNAGTPSNPTGPVVDHTLGTSAGVYVYMETSGGTTGDSADFVSPPIYIDTNFSIAELKYWYFNFGANVDRMEVIVDTNGTENVVASYIGQQQTAQTDSWLEESIFLNGYQGKSVVLKFRGFNPPCCTGDLAIDDISLDPVPQLNAFTEALIEPSGSLCGGSINPVVAIGSGGIDTITFVDVVLDVNGVLDTVRYNGNLGIGDTAHVTLPAITISSGVVYDMKFYTINPNGGTDGLNSDDTLTLDGLTTGLSGTITLDTSLPASASNYTSFSALANQLNLVGVCGDVTIDVAAGTYDDVFLLNNVPGLSDTSRLTVDGGDSASVTLENDLANDGAIVGFDATSYVTIKNMTLRSLNNGTADHFGVHFTGASSYDSIVNCRILMNTTNSFGVFGVGASASITDDFAEGNNANYVTVMNSSINGASYSIHFEGPPTGNWNVGNSFINNTLTNMDDYGIYTDQQDSMKIIGNSITGMRSAFGDGISCFDHMNFEINSNLVIVEDYGIYVTNANSGDDADREATLINNMVTSFGDYGIYLTGPSRINIWHNSVYSEGTVSSVRLLNAIDSLDIRNNVFASETSEAFEMSGGADTTIFLRFDNNVFNVSGAGNLLDIDNNTYATLVDYQTARPGFNINSLEGSPEFISDSNLHILGSFINDAGDNGVNILVDIDGDVRPSSIATNVDPGADEFDPPACAAPLSIAVSVFSADSATVTWIANTASGGVVQVNLTGRGNAIGSGVIDSSSTNEITYDSLTPETQYDVYVREICRRGDTSIWAGPFEFETPCITFPAPYEEDFENGGTIPNCMSQGVSNSEDWIFATTGGHVGFAGTITGSTKSNNLFAYVDDSSPHNQSTTLETPFVDVSSLTNPTLEFYRLSDNEGNLNGNVDFTVDVWDGAAWNQVYFADTNSAGRAWEFISIPLNGLTITGDIQARFIVDENNGTIFDDDVAIDDIYIGDRLPLDVGVSSIIAPQSLSGNDSCNLGSVADLIVQLENFGTTFIDSLDVTFIFDNNTPITQRFRNLNLNLANSTQVTFDSTINLVTSGTYPLAVYTSLSGDGNSGNDTTSVSIINEGFAGMIVGVDSICSGDSAVLTVANSSGTLQWQELISGVWTDISGADSLSIVVKPSSIGNYRVQSCGADTSDTYSVTAVSLSAPTVNKNDSIVVVCGQTGSDTLIVDSQANTVMKWFDAPTEGNIVNSGDTLIYTVNTVGPPSSTLDTFYVASTTAGGGSGGNIAPDATVLGSTCNTGVCSDFNDLDFGSCGTQDVWVNTTTPPSTVAGTEWIEWTFSRPRSFDTLVIHNGYDNRRFITGALVQYWNGSAWVNHSSFTNLPAACVNRVAIGKLTADRFRITSFEMTGIGQQSNPSFREIEIIEVAGCESPRTMIIGEVSCALTTAIDDISTIDKRLNIYPNPSNGVFKLDISTEQVINYNLVLRNVNGKVVYSDDFVVNGTYQDQLDFSELAKGVYYLKIKTAESMEVKKLIIQ